MTVFTYTAKNRAGEKLEGTIEANDRRSAVLMIERQGQVPVSITEKSVAAPRARRRLLLWHGARERMGARDLLLFTTELSDLLVSGMTLGNALNCIANRKTGRSSDTIVASLRDQIVKGTSLSDALAQYPETFPKLYVSMVRAGEASGSMVEVLRRLVAHLEKSQELKEKVVMALVYPMIVMIMGAATLIFSMVYVVPRFKEIFAQLGETLPLPTRILINSSAWLVRYGWLALIVVVIGVVLLHRATRTRQGQRVWHRFLLRLPLVRGIVASGIYANLARTLGTLLSNGVPALQALGIVEQTVGNVIIGQEIHRARGRVTDGTTISAPLAAGKVFPVMMTDMLAIGEQTGDMTSALEHIAMRYESELDRNIKIFTTALEPLLIVVVAVLVGFVAISILMAVFNMTNGLNV